MTDWPMPEGWQIKALGELLTSSSDLTYGVVQPGSECADGVPIVRVKDIRGGRIATDEPLRISPDIEKQYQRSRIEGGELLVTLVGTVGETAVAPNELRGWNTARAVATVRLPTADDSEWVGYCLQTPEGKNRIGSRVNTTVQTTLNLKDLREFPVILPPIAERRAITGVLRALDDKIESDRRLARVAQDLARSELERVCADSSSRVAVRDVVRSVHERRKSDNPRFPYIGLEHFNGFDLALWRYGKAADTTSAVKVCESGDLVFGRIRPYFGNVALAGQAAVVAQSIEVLRPIRENDLEAVFLRLSSREFIDAATTISSGTTMPQVKWTDLEAEEIVVPTPDRMIQFRKVAAPLFELLKRLPSEVESLASIRNSLLPELLSGRIHVRDAETIVERVS